jgi:hypothetical protein
MNLAQNPAWQSAVSNVVNNPYFNQALGGAQTAAGYGGQTASQLMGMLPGLGGAESQILQTAFDPQNALYNRTAQQVLDQQRAINAMSGVGTSPYGAGVTGQSMQNFNIDWQNNLLQRMLSGAQGATGLAGAIGNLGQQATGLEAQAAGLPANVWQQQQQNVLGALSGAGQGLGQVAQGLGTAQQLPLNWLQAQNALGAAPYNMAAGTSQNALSSLGSLLQLGSQQYQLPQQVLSDLASYMQLGQNASQVGGNLGALASQQSALAGQGLGSLLGAGSNLLFGSQGLTGALGLGTTGLIGGLL